MGAQHTPGPWAFEGFDVTVHNGVEQHDFGYVSVTDKAGEWQSICSVQGSNPIVSGLSREECGANAALISAAPDLLIQLKGLLGFAQFVISAVDIDTEMTKVVLRNKGEAVAEVPISTLLAHTEAAIAKAEGRS